MRTQRFPLAGETPPRLELRWKGSQARVYLDGNHETTIDGFAGMKRGWSKQLEDGRTIEVRTIRRGGFPELSVLLDGEHLPSSPSHPEKVLRTSSNVMLGLSAFVIFTGISDGWERAWLEIVFGVFYVIGALLLRSGRRLGAAVIAVPLFIRLDLLLLVAIFDRVDWSWFVDVALNLLFATFVVRSWQAARETQLLRQKRVT